MRILFLASSADRYGSERALKELALSLSAMRCTVAVTVPCEGPLSVTLREAGIPTRSAPLFVLKRALGPGAVVSFASAGLRTRKELVEAHRSFRPDVVYSNTSHVVDGPPLARALGAKHVWHLREIERVPDALRHLYGRWLLATGARVLPISQAVRQAYFPRPAPRVVVTPDGVDIAHYGVEVSSRQPDEYTAARPLRLLAIGRLTPWKGQDVAIEAVGSLLETGAPAQLRVVGGAITDNDALFERRLRQLAGPFAGSISIEPEVDDVRPLYRWCDVVLHTAVRPEPFGRVIVEAMASGRVAVATNLGGPREIVREGVDGLLVSPGDRKTLALTIRKLLQDPRLVETMGAAARVRAESFTAQATAQRVSAVLSEVCADVRVAKWRVGDE